MAIYCRELYHEKLMFSNNVNSIKVGTTSSTQYSCTTRLFKNSTSSYLGKRERNDNNVEPDSIPEMGDDSRSSAEFEGQTPVQLHESYKAHMAELAALEAELHDKYTNCPRTIAQVKAEIKAIQRPEPPLGFCRHPVTGQQWKRQMIDSDPKRTQKQWDQWCNFPKNLRIPAEDGYESGDSNIDNVNEFLATKRARKARKIIRLRDELEELLQLESNLLNIVR
ncbi:hypothetical protein BGZ60DRAFT_408866 [Tricladium varicosporioides]|nr:hypothetical protein BGZ60DRAFT_408866 [Hymenoscyphus varicosporioides]